MNREPLDILLYRFKQNEKWARLFTFAMTALGLFVVLGLVGLTTWGFASYDSAKRNLSDTNRQLELSQKKIGELESLANSNVSTAVVVSLQHELANAQQRLVEKEAEIANLNNRLGNSSSATPTPSEVPQDFSKYQATIDQQKDEIQRLNNQNSALTERLNNCLMKQSGRKKASSTVERPVVTP
jgi:chromosome segregation ATPase